MKGARPRRHNLAQLMRVLTLDVDFALLCFKKNAPSADDICCNGYVIMIIIIVIFVVIIIVIINIIIVMEIISA